MRFPLNIPTLKHFAEAETPYETGLPVIIWLMTDEKKHIDILQDHSHFLVPFKNGVETGMAVVKRIGNIMAVKEDTWMLGGKWICHHRKGEYETPTPDELLERLGWARQTRFHRFEHSDRLRVTKMAGHKVKFRIKKEVTSLMRPGDIINIGKDDRFTLVIYAVKEANRGPWSWIYCTFPKWLTQYAYLKKEDKEAWREEILGECQPT